MDDLYGTLGVSKGATDAEIKRAFRTLARKHHPDANPGDASAEERFKKINHAYDVLSDKEKRREYDAAQRFGGFGRGPNGGFGGTGAGPSGSGGFGDFADLFGSIFRGGRGGGGTAQERTAPRRGADIEVEVALSFEQAMAGVQIPVTIDKHDTCATCSGTGAKPGTSPRLCPECKGRGIRGRDVGGFSLSEPCRRCGGEGTVIDEPCPTCGGSGSIAGRRTYRVRIPAGAKDGTKVRVKGKGQAGLRGGPPGDLYVVTRVTPSALFTREGDDLAVQVPVTFSEAALGARIEVPTTDGRVKLRVPAGSQDGKALRVPGKGAPRLDGSGRGDLIARLKVQVPSKMSDPQREALERYADLDEGDPREGLFS
jgi:molecular chaperone DnaJ